MRATLGTLAYLLAFGLGPALAGAYSVLPPKWPGSIKGTVKAQGPLPAEPPMTLGPGCPQDAAALLAPSKDGTLAGVVVFLEDVATGKEPPRRSMTLELRNCQGLPQVWTLGVGDELAVLNLDPVFHQVKVTQAGIQGNMRQEANLGMPVGGQRYKVKLAQPGSATVTGVGVHSSIHALVRVFEHPYHTVSSAEGTFDLKDVPPGHYVLHFWHARWGDVVRQVEVKAGYPTKVEVVLPGPGVKG